MSAEFPLSLLHFDTHAYDDIISDEIYECSPGQFFQYDQMVIEILELTEDLIDNFIDLDTTDNITNEMMKIGYFPNVIWVYPDHWLNFSTTIAYDVHYKLYLQYAQHQTYYITPLNGLTHKYSMLLSDTHSSDKHDFWSNILFKNSIEMVDKELNSSQSLKVDIMAIPLSTLLTEPSLISHPHQIVLDIDLDFFCCQNIAENIMERFEWNNDLIQQLNTILNHHQYLPNHIPNDLYQNSLITLMHMLIKNEQIPMNDTKNKTKQISIPKISDIVKLASTNDSILSIYDLQHTLHFLYRFQLELGEEFIESLELFIATHLYLDALFNETGDSIKRWESMPYNHSKHRHIWHTRLANTLNMEHTLTPFEDISSISINSDGSVKPQNNQEFNANILPYLQIIKQKRSDKTKDRKKNNVFENSKEESIDNNNEDIKSISYSSDDVLQIAVVLKHILQFTEHQHKISNHLIETYLNQTKHYSSNVNIQNLTNVITQQETKIWNPDHDWFHKKINKKHNQILNDEKEDSLQHLSYPQILQMFGINPSYKYSEWTDIIKEFNNETWTKHYIKSNQSELMFETPDTISFNKSKLELTTDNIDEIISWHKLDKIQQHFLQNGDHRAMHKYINNLNSKQKLFLKWLLFCFYHPENCEDGHHPFELINNKEISKVIFGEKFQWNALIRIPAFVESATQENRGLLQLEFVSLGPTQDWLPTAKHEMNYIPTKEHIKQNVNTITKFLSSQHITVIAGGIELSRGYVPFKYQIWVECLLMKSLHKAFYMNNSNSKISFTRYQDFLDDDSKNDILSNSIQKIPKCLKHISSRYI
eukprot:351449_1